MGLLERIVAGVVTVAGLGFLAGSQPACSSNSDTQVIEHPCPDPSKPCDTSLTILHTSDIHSRLFPYEQIITQVDATLGLGELNTVVNVGGVARMSYVLQRERARAGRVIHLDSGDVFQGAPIFNYFKGEPEVRAMDALECDAMVIGNHEFDSGAQNVATQFGRWANFPFLSADYKFDNTSSEGPSATNARLGSIARPFVVLNQGGLKIAVIGLANLDTLSSLYDQPNRLGITPLNQVEVTQFYIDLLRPYVDLIGAVSHLGLQNDQEVIRGTTGLDFIMGGHNHVVINPPQEIRDCSAEENHPGFVWAVDPNQKIDPSFTPPDDRDPALAGPAGDLDPVNHPFAFKRPCKPRRVVIAHSGAFAKYVGRLDLVLTNDPVKASPTGQLDADGDGKQDYDPLNGFEIQDIRYQIFPITAQIPDDPVIVDMLQPYRRVLDRVADLDIIVGYSPDGSKRSSSNGGDAPLGNIVGTAIWLRLGIQTDFAMTNTTGIRADLNPGPVTIEQMFNIFPFDNSIAKMQLSGEEVQELFDFSARRSAQRGCTSQIQIAGARVRLDCTGCTRLDVPCKGDAECVNAGRDSCDTKTGKCVVHCAKGQEDPCPTRIKGSSCNTEIGQCEISACAENVYIGTTSKTCQKDEECSTEGKILPGSCSKGEGRQFGLCLSQIQPTNLYELATSNYLAGGGSGFRVLQRNTTQFDTKVQQRDALIDYLRQGKPCGYDKNAGTDEGLKACSTDKDCDPLSVCACPGHAKETSAGVCETDGSCDSGAGRCVRRSCRNQVAAFHNQRCSGIRPEQVEACKTPLEACQLAGEECKILSCIDATIGNFSDNRVEMIGR
jgi:5'-nucleotidase